LLAIYLPPGIETAMGRFTNRDECTPFTAMKPTSDHGGTRLAAAVDPHLAAHPEQSGLHPFPDGLDALAARLFLANAAVRMLDVQYYIWKQDMVGRILLERLLCAAACGAKVRMLLDDYGTAPSDVVLLAIDSHPNIEVRTFNPVSNRSRRKLGIVRRDTATHSLSGLCHLALFAATSGQLNDRLLSNLSLP
jgi:phosphatidylserine/phosphatidylglycerophosphate/cardiolipin synthase-like enzyme